MKLIQWFLMLKDVNAGHRINSPQEKCLKLIVEAYPLFDLHDSL